MEIIVAEKFNDTSSESIICLVPHFLQVNFNFPQYHLAGSQNTCCDTGDPLNLKPKKYIE